MKTSLLSRSKPKRVRKLLSLSGELFDVSCPSVDVLSELFTVYFFLSDGLKTGRWRFDSVKDLLMDLEDYLGEARVEFFISVNRLRFDRELLSAMNKLGFVRADCEVPGTAPPMVGGGGD